MRSRYMLIPLPHAPRQDAITGRIFHRRLSLPRKQGYESTEPTKIPIIHNPNKLARSDLNPTEKIPPLKLCADMRSYPGIVTKY